MQNCKQGTFEQYFKIKPKPNWDQPYSKTVNQVFIYKIEPKQIWVYPNPKLYKTEPKFTERQPCIQNLK